MAPPKRPASVLDEAIAAPLEDDEEEELQWRGDSKKTFSDWRLEIVHKNEGRVDTYNVHKFVLAYGARKSRYFEKLFSSDFKENQECSSRIELEPLAAVAFPQLLDYLYKSYKPLLISTETATALHFLGEYFEMPRLRWDAKQFCSKNMSFENSLTYAEHTVALHDETIYKLLAQFLGRKIMEVNPTSPLVQNTEPSLWIEVLKCVPLEVKQMRSEKEKKLFSMHFSRIVANLNRDSLTKEMFQVLTLAEEIPQVDYSITLMLCEMDDNLSADVKSGKIVQEENDDSQAIHLFNGSEMSLSESRISLQNRCAISLSHRFWNFASPNDEIIKALKERKPSFLVELLVTLLKESRGAFATLKDEHTSLRGKYDRMSRKLLKATQTLDAFSPTVNEQLSGRKMRIPEGLMKGKRMQGSIYTCITTLSGKPVFIYSPSAEK